MVEWNEIEIKVRNLLKDLVEPTMKRVAENRKEIDSNRQLLKASNKKLELVESSCDSLSLKVQPIENYGRKILELSSAQRILQVKFESEKEYYKSKFEEIQRELSGYGEDLRSVLGLKETMQSEFTAVTHKINKTSIYVDDQIRLTKGSFSSKFYRYDDLLDDIQQNIQNLKTLNEKYTIQNSKLEMMAQKSIRMNDQNNNRITEMSNKLKDTSRVHSENLEKIRSAMWKSISKNANDLTVLEKQIKEIQIRSFIDMNDFLSKINSNPKTKSRILTLGIEQYNDWVQDTSISYLSEIVNTAKGKCIDKLNEIKTNSKTKKKSKIDLKKPTKLLKQESELKNDAREEFVSKTFPKEFTEEEFVKELIPEDIQEKSNEGTLILPSNSKRTIDNEEYSIQSSESSDNESDIEDMKTQINDIYSLIKTIKQEFKKSQKFISSKIESIYSSLNTRLIETTEPLSSRMNDLAVKNTDYSNLMEKSLTRLDTLSGNLDSEIANTNHKVSELQSALESASSEFLATNQLRKRLITDLKLEFQSLGHKVDGFQEKTDTIAYDLSTLKQCSDIIIDYLRIQSSLECQDETDRESIALVGFQDKKQKASKTRPPISIDPKCLSCTNQKSFITHSFKMACLLYAPSHVNFNGGSFPRKELLETQRKLIDAMHDPRQFVNLSNFLSSSKLRRPKTLRRKEYSMSLNHPQTDVPSMDEFPKLSRRLLSSGSVIL